MKLVTSSVILATQSCSTLLSQPGHRARQAFMTDDTSKTGVGIAAKNSVSGGDDWRTFEHVTNLILRRCQGSGRRTALALVAVLAGGRHRREMLDTLGALPATCDEGVVYAHLADLQVDGVDSLRREVKLRFMECLLIRALRFAHRLAGTDSPEDLAQDVGSRLLNRYETKPVTAVILWRSAYVAVFRGWVRRNERRLPEILSGLDVGADLASNESVEQRVEQREELRRVLNVIRSFPPRERENLIRVLHRSTDAGDILQDDSSGLQSRDAEKRALTRARNRLREQTRLATDDAGDRHEKGQDEESETEEEDK